MADYTTLGSPSIDTLSDEEIAYLIQQHEQEQQSLSGLSDEELESMLQTFKPQGGSLADIKPVQAEKPKPELSAGELVMGPAREFFGGAAFELADEYEASKISAASGIPYDRILEYIRQQKAKYGEAHPNVALASNVAGGILSSLIPGVGALGKGFQGATGISKLASPLARTAVTGAVSGGVSGFGAGEDMTERLTNIPIGAGMGAGFGVGAYGLGKGLSYLKGILTSRGMTDEEAARTAAIIVSRRLSEGGTTPEQAADILSLEQKYGLPSVFGTTTPELTRLTESVVQTPSAEQESLIKRLFAQQTGDENIPSSKARVRKLTQEAIPTPDYFDTADNVQNALRRNADATYKRAYQAGDINDPDINNFLTAPDVQSAYQDAIANSARMKEAARLRGEDPSEYDLRELFVVDPMGNVKVQNVPDIRTLDFIKQAMDRRINSLYSSGQGSEATALRAMRDAFVDKLDKVGPAEYKAARQQYKGDIEIREALELGKNSAGMRWQEFNKLAKDYSDGELQAFKTGFMQNIAKRFEDNQTNRNFAKDLLAENNMRKFGALMDPGEFKVFEASLKLEKDMFDRINRVTQGSQTYGRQAQRARIESEIGKNDSEGLINVMMNPTAGAIFRRVMSNVAKLRDANASERVYAQLARILKAGDPQEIDDVLARLEAAAPEQKAMDEAFERKATRTAVSAGKIVAPSPVVPEPEAGEFPPILELPPLEEPSAEPSGPGGPQASTEGGVNIYDALTSLMPDWDTLIATGGISGPSGIISGEDVAKALGIPLSSWLSYVGNQ